MNSPLLPMHDPADSDVCCSPLRQWFPFALILLLAGSVAGLLASQLTADEVGATPKAGAVNKAVVVDEQQADEKPGEIPELEYVRIRKNERKLAVALETSVIHFADSKKFPDATVDLIGAIHLGEPDYYQQLNKLFESYDVLLFEAVMPEDAVKRDMRPGGGDGSRRKGLDDEVEWTEAKVGLAARNRGQGDQRDQRDENTLGGLTPPARQVKSPSKIPSPFAPKRPSATPRAKLR